MNTCASGRTHSTAESASARVAPTLTDRALSLIGEVRPGERASALLLSLNVFLLLTAYYLLKVVREPLILLNGAFGIQGATFKASAAAAQALLLLAVIPMYGRLAGRVSRMKLINTVAAASAICLLGFSVLAYLEVAVGFAFFIWVGIFNLLIVAQFWSFANDIYTEEQGKRIFAIVGFGATAGAIVGAWIGGAMASVLSPGAVILAAAVVLVLAVVITNLVDLANTPKPGVTGENAAPAPEMSTIGGFKLVFKRRYLLLIALMTLTYTTVNSNGEFILGHTVRARAIEMVQAEVPDDLTPAETSQEIEERAAQIIGGFYGTFFTHVNLLSALIQLFLVSRVFKYLGVRAALFFLPTIALGSYATMTLIPLLSIIKAGKVLENGTDYSLQNTTRHALFLPTSRDAKYKGKATIDTAFVRFGDVGSFFIIYSATAWLGMSAIGVALINIALISVWMSLCYGISGYHRELTAETPTASLAEVHGQKSVP